MKKTLITGLAALLLISSASFARGGNGQGNAMGNGQQSGYNQQQEVSQGQQGNFGMNRQEMKGQGSRTPELTDEQVEQVKAIHDKYEVQIETLMIDIEKVNLEIREEQLGDKTDWTAVEKLLDEESELKSDSKLLRMKIREEVENEVGVDLPEPGNRGGSKGSRRGIR